MASLEFEEIKELQAIRGWTTTRLASELALSYPTVAKWMKDQCVPDGPVRLLLRRMVDEARSERKKVAK